MSFALLTNMLELLNICYFLTGVIHSLDVTRIWPRLKHWSRQAVDKSVDILLLTALVVKGHPTLLWCHLAQSLNHITE